VVPASIVSVLFMVGGITIWSAYAQMADAAAASGENIWIVVGPTFLFPVWAVSLAVATLGYYYRRRGPCSVCARGVSGKPEK
jgi:predicted small integral membrane protein